MDPMNDSQLKKLGETHLYKVAGDSHDIRGWIVADEQGVSLGKVSDLLFDTQNDEVRYAVVETADKQVLVPIGSLGFEEDSRRVVVMSFTADRLRALPAYGDLPMTLDDERAHYTGILPEHQAAAPLDYSISPFHARVPERIQRIEERLREDRRHDEHLPLPLDRELSFAGTEPDEAELVERNRIEHERLMQRVERNPRGELDFGLDRPR